VSFLHEVAEDGQIGLLAFVVEYVSLDNMLRLGPLLELPCVFCLQKIMLHHSVLVVSMISRMYAAVFCHLFHLDPVLLKFYIVLVVFY